jgi:hypothetical protein
MSRSGRGQGVLLYYRQWLQPYVQGFEVCDKSVWLMLRAGADTPVLTVAVQYLNPGRATAMRSEWFSQLQDRLVAAKQQGHVLLMGDFNAHTKLLRDHEQTAQVFEQLGMAGLLPVPGVPDRCNTDVSRHNAYGQALVSMCRATGVVIANGRVAGDLQGASTFVRADGVSSVIDYCLVDTELLPAMQELRVGPKPWMWGDHNPMAATLRVQQFGFGVVTPESIGTGGTGSANGKVPRWDPARKAEYGSVLAEGQAAEALVVIQQGVVSGTLPADQAA